MFATRAWPGLFGGGSVLTAYPVGVSASAIFLPDGTSLYSNPFAITQWHSTPYSGLGSLYWMRFTKTGGVRNVTNNGVIVSLAGTAAGPATWSVTGGAGSVQGNWEIFSDAGGTTLVASGTFDLNNTL